MNGMQNQNGGPTFDQNTMNQIQQAASSLQQQLNQMNMTPQQRLEQGMMNGSISQERYQWARQMANMQTMFGLQQQLSQCCCDNRLATAQTQALVQSENCEDRNALQRGITDVLIGSNANTQRLVDTMNGGFQGLQDKLCQLELDGYKRDLDAANARILSLENQAARAADRAAIIANNEAQTSILENYLNPPARPAYVVPNPNGCNCGYNYGGCCN